MAGNSESVKRSEKTKKEKYGTDYHARMGAIGGRARKRGYFGRLKDEGKLDELKALAKKVVKKETLLKVSGPSLSDYPLKFEEHPGEKKYLTKKNTAKKIRSKVEGLAKVPKRKSGKR